MTRIDTSFFSTSLDRAAPSEYPAAEVDDLLPFCALYTGLHALPLDMYFEDTACTFLEVYDDSFLREGSGH